MDHEADSQAENWHELFQSAEKIVNQICEASPQAQLAVIMAIILAFMDRSEIPKKVIRKQLGDLIRLSAK